MSLPASYDTTRHALHTVAEHVLAKARYLAVGRIGLAAAPGGFATPAFDGRVVRVDGTDLVVDDAAGERRVPLTTLRAAGELVGVTPGMPHDVYRPATPLVSTLRSRSSPMRPRSSRAGSLSVTRRSSASRLSCVATRASSPPIARSGPSTSTSPSARRR